MSILDKFRDSLYEPDEEDLENEITTTAIAGFTDSFSDPFAAIRALVIALTAEIGAALLIYFAHAAIAGFLKEGNMMILALLVPFVIGFVIAFATYRLFEFRFRPNANRPSVRSGFMSGFAAYDQRSSQWPVWLIAVAGGVSNTLAVFLFFSTR